MKFFLYSVFVLLLSPCNASKKTSSAAVNDYSKVEISYKRTPCFGKCPVYTLTINGNTRTATFNGEHNTEKMGVYTRPVTDNELEQLVSAFEKANFNSLNDNYMGEITDFPVKTISYSNNGKAKTITNRSGAPQELLLLEKTLNNFAETTEGWKKSETADH